MQFLQSEIGLNINEAPFFDDQTPSPTSQHPAFRDAAAKSNTGLSSDFDDGWKSFKIEDDNEFDESVLHKVGCTRLAGGQTDTHTFVKKKNILVWADFHFRLFFAFTLENEKKKEKRMI